MPGHGGSRRDTRDQLTRPFRKNGMPGLATYLHTYKRGDVVDIATNSAVHAGMPHKHYHGRTGRVFNVTKSGVGVEVNKILREKQLKKRILVKVAHVRHSTALLEIQRRTKENEAHKAAVRSGKAEVNLTCMNLLLFHCKYITHRASVMCAQKKVLKRLPVGPKAGYEWEPYSVTTIAAQPFVNLA